MAAYRRLMTETHTAEKYETDEERRLRLERQRAHELDLRQQTVARLNAQGEDTYFVQRELLALFNVSRPTLWAWRRRGVFPEPVKLVGSQRLYWRRSVIEAWRAEREAA